MLSNLCDWTLESQNRNEKKSRETMYTVSAAITDSAVASIHDGSGREFILL